MKRKVISSWILRASLAMTVAVVAIVFSMPSLQAQIDAGTILGTVTDTSGAVIKGASVTLTNEGTNVAVTTESSSEGAYKFTPVPIGTYKVTVGFAGFQTTTHRAITVNVGANVVVDVQLKPGQVSENVEVTAVAPVLQSQNASVGQVVDERSVGNLPLNGRNFTFLAQIAAGVNTPQADTRGNAASGAFSANGLRPAQNNYLLDGVDNNSDTVDFLNGTNFVVLPPVDAIQEFKVDTSGFSAQYGRSGAAVLNATIKSGTNTIHGTLWEFLRNDKFDARDFFEHNPGQPKAEFRQNQFGGAAGGPIWKNKIFIFGDYEGLRRRQGAPATAGVPTLAERTSNFTDFSDLIAAQSGTKQDALGRTVPLGTIFDPATTRKVIVGSVDPVSGITTPAVTNGATTPLPVGTAEYVRDPFGTCGPATLVFTLGTCGLNHLPAGRLDANAVKLLGIFPAPTNNSAANFFQNFSSANAISENRNSFDARMDLNLSQNNQIFFRFSYVDDPQLIPGVFTGIADGGGFQQGAQTALAQQSVLNWTHTFSPTMINVARVGMNYLRTTRAGQQANDLSNIPGQFGVLGIAQTHLNGGLPAFGINGLQTLGSNAFLPSDEVSSTIQITDDFTKIYGKHTFKMGFEMQHVKFSTLQPPWSRGQFNYNGIYTDTPENANGQTGRAEALLIPAVNIHPCATTATTDCPNFVGGPATVFLSNISLSDNGKNYYGTYINDDWKVTSKLTVNLGVRWDFFGLTYDHYGKQANFVPGGLPTGAPMYIIPNGVNAGDLSTGPNGFTTLLAKDGIKLATTDVYGKGLGSSQTKNFSPRLGFAYQATSKFVVRGGFGMFFNGFENRGYSPNLGENYPFQFNFSFFNPDNNHAMTPYAGCATATPIGSPTLETGFSCTPLDALSVNAGGLALRGIQFHYVTPYSMGSNLTLQYQLTPSFSIQAGYVNSLARHLESFPGSNNVTQILDTSLNADNFKPFLDFSRGASYAATIGSSYYHALQVTLEKRYSAGLNLLATYTWSQARSDAGDLLNGGVGSQYRAPDVPGFGIHADYGLANFDIRNVIHLSGGYELPFGKGKHFMSNAGGAANKVFGGWSVNWITTLQGGQPVNIQCANGTTSGTGCNALMVAGQNPYIGTVAHFYNAAAFTQPCKLIAGGIPQAGNPVGCIPLTGLAALGGPPQQVHGPGFHRADISIFKDIPFNERIRMQFRAEMFNITNHPNFNAPNFGGNGVVSISGSGNFTNSSFGQIGSTRDNPNDPREIQFALKLYF